MKMNQFENPSKKNPEDREDNKIEKEQRPEKLYRGFTIHPDDLSLEKFEETFVPENANEDDSTKISDGNELGVYMSTNLNMVKAAYAHNRNIENLNIKTLKHTSNRGGTTEYIELPTCGIIIEVETKGLDIRRPEISSVLQGVNNNNFEGEEWVADSISPEHYEVKKLVLANGPNDVNKTEIDVSGFDNNQLQEVIDDIKKEFNIKRDEALMYKNFIESLGGKERLINKFSLQRKWEQFKKDDDNKDDTSQSEAGEAKDGAKK